RGMASLSLSTGSGTPITPVEAVRTSCTLSRPSVAAAAPARSSLSHVPRSPLAQFALPLLTTTAPTAEPAANLARLRDTHGALTRFVVETSAHASGCGE